MYEEKLATRIADFEKAQSSTATGDTTEEEELPEKLSELVNEAAAHKYELREE